MSGGGTGTQTSTKDGGVTLTPSRGCRRTRREEEEDGRPCREKTPGREKLTGQGRRGSGAGGLPVGSSPKTGHL